LHWFDCGEDCHFRPCFYVHLPNGGTWFLYLDRQKPRTLWL
jgi:hypothetical protein